VAVGWTAFERVCSQTQLCQLRRHLMAILDNYMFRPLLAIFSLSSRELKEGRGTRIFITPAKQEPSNLTVATRPYHASSHRTPPHMEITLSNKALCRDLCTTCALNVYSRTLSSLEDKLKMASKGRNM